MFRTVEERLTMLEQTVERQAFQIELLQQQRGQQNDLNQLILASNMNRQCYLELQAMTKEFELKVNNGYYVALHEFISSFERILLQHEIRLTSSALADLIPAWLRGKNGSVGFSAMLHEYFYH